MVSDLTSQNDLGNFRKKEVLVDPAGLQDLEYNVTKSKYEYLEQVWVIQKIGIAPARVQFFTHDIRYQCKQYGLRHCVTSTIHYAMSNNLIKVVLEISNDNGMFKLWYKSQVIFGCSRTRISRNTIFLGEKYSTIYTLTSLIQLKNQRTDYMKSEIK